MPEKVPSDRDQLEMLRKDVDFIKRAISFIVASDRNLSHQVGSVAMNHRRTALKLAQEVTAFLDPIESDLTDIEALKHANQVAAEVAARLAVEAEAVEA